jgi:hypothetical protein
MSKPEETKKADDGAAEEPKVETVSIGNHPRARASIRRARTSAALAAFAIVLLLGLNGGQTAFDATWRALLAGIVVNIVVWRLAIAWWRQIIINEVRAVEEKRLERRQAAREEAERRAAAAMQQQADQDDPGFRAA